MALVHLVVCFSLCLGVQSQFLDSFAVEFDGDREELERFASSHGFVVFHQFKYSEIFLLRHSALPRRSKRSAVEHVDILRSHPKVTYAEQEEVLQREKRFIIHDKMLEMPLREITDNSVYQRVPEARLATRDHMPTYLVPFSDPLYRDQWSIVNKGQGGGRPGLDGNVPVAWANGYTGAGVTVCILDDGMDHTHADLVNNYDSSASADLNDLKDKDNDPMPDMSTEEKESENRHGTWCAGEIASAGHNDVCGVGVAFECSIGAIRLLDGDVTDAMEAEALNYNFHHIDIFSASWGPPDNGKTFDKPRNKAVNALRKGVREGRNGKGNIYVWATGNGGQYGDNCGADGYVGRIETMSFGSTTDKGTMPYFMEQCTSTLAVVPTGGEEVKGEEDAQGIVKIKVVTTDLNNGCIENFQGTSSAAPYAAACVALVLQANPDVTWRDVQHIVINSARIPSVDHSWIINAAKFHVSHTFGFGIIDCGMMVALAQTWVNVPEQRKCVNQRMAVNKYIPSKKHIRDELLIACHGEGNRIHNLEHVHVQVRLEHSRRGDVEMFLVSPSNTWSRILALRPLDDSDKGIDFEFMTVHAWGEDPTGTWALYIVDRPSKPNRVNTGKLLDWTLTLYGTGKQKMSRVETTNKKEPEAVFPNLVEVERIMKEEEKKSIEVKVTPLKDTSSGEADATPPIPGNPPIPGSGPGPGPAARLLEELISNFDRSPESAAYNIYSEDNQLGKNREVLIQQKKYINSKSSPTKKSEEDQAIDELADALLFEIKSEEKQQIEEKWRKEEEERRKERRKEAEKKYIEEHLLDELVKQLEDELEHTDNVRRVEEKSQAGEEKVRKKQKKDEEEKELLELLKDFTGDSRQIQEKKKTISSEKDSSVEQNLHKQEEMRGQDKEEDLTNTFLSELLHYLQEES